MNDHLVRLSSIIVLLSCGTYAISLDYCLFDNVAGCELGRSPQYLVVAPRRVRAEQVFQVFTTILRMEYGQNQSVSVRVSVVRSTTEVTSGVMNFDRPSSRIMQLRIPETALPGEYHLRVEGRLSNSQGSGIAFSNQTRLEFNTKRASIFIQMSKPIYRQEQMVHFRVVPIQPNMMPQYGNLIIYVEDPSGVAVRRWQGLQTNVGGMVSQSFQLSDQPNYGTWHIVVEAFGGHVYRRPFIVEEFWEPRFDVNVTSPAYLMDTKEMMINVSVLANQTSGRPCVGNASITVYFVPRDDVWNQTRGWEKPYHASLTGSDVPQELPAYRPLADIPVKDYSLYFPYAYHFIDYYVGRIDLHWTREDLVKLAKEGGQPDDDLVDSQVLFFANVSDWYSGLNRTGWASTVLYRQGVRLKWVGGPTKTFKPGSRLKIQVAVSHYDGTPVARGGAVSLSTILRHSVGGATSEQDGVYQTQPVLHGIAEFDLVLDLSTESFTLKALYYDPDELKAVDANVNTQFVRHTGEAIEMRGNKYYSPSNSYIAITTSTRHPQVNEFMVFHIKVSHFVPRIFYQVVSQGNVIIGDELLMTSRQKTISIGLSREMVPTARLIVHYVRDPEEVVADVLNFFVNGTKHNQVKLGINRGKDFSRDTVEFNAEADPGSYVAFSAMLLDLYSRGMSDGITENKLIDELLTFDQPASGSYQHLWRVSDTEYEYKFFHGYDYGIDGTTTFRSAGVLILTDAEVTRLPNQDSCDPKAGLYPCFSGVESECFQAEQRCNRLFDGCPNDGADEWNCEYEKDQLVHQTSIDRVSRVMRLYDNSSWAWQEIFVKPDGRVDFRVDAPKYPLTWVINGLSVSRDLGLGIMQKPVLFDSTRSMYIQVEHPKSIVWGEQVGVRITVFNYWYADDYIEVLITMHGSPQLEFVDVGEMGYVTSYAPPTHKGDRQTIVFLEPGESKDIYMPIVAAKTYHGDELNFRVTAKCFIERDSYEGSMSLLPNGVLNYYHTPYLIDLIRYPSVEIPQFKVNAPEDFRRPKIRNNLYVPQSPASMTTFFGDVAMPGFFENYLNAENLLYRPYGSGEMVTFNFAYNMLTIKFMKQSSQLDLGQLKEVIAELNLALQRIFGYMNGDEGSFKMFRDDPHSNLWLTAFVGKTLSDAGTVLGEREKDMYIPQDLIRKITTYVCSKQHASGAFFMESGQVMHDRKMASEKNMTGDKLYAHEIPLTAYVLIALHNMNTFATGMPCIENAMRSSARFLASKVHSLGEDQVFFLAISAYALTLTQASTDAVHRLWTMRRNDSDYLYFANQEVYENPFDFVNNIKYLLPRQELMNDAHAVQTTAYALLGHVQAVLPDSNQKSMVVKWLGTMRNSFAGFSSTQDTLVAMEALYAFTRTDPNRNEFDMRTTLMATSSPYWQRTHRLIMTNYTIMNRDFLPLNKAWGYIIPSARGAGRAMLQVTTTLRVEYPGLMKTQQRYGNNPNSDPIPFFTIEDQAKFRGRNDSIMEMTNCVSWVYTEKSLTSGLAVLEVDIPTGYVVMNDSLRDYVRSGIVPNLRRAEFYGRKVVYYFDYLDQSKTCVFFRADRWYPVANTTQENRIRVYDYYEPGMHRTRMYTVKNLFLLSICFVCGSYQCPYCPYFNAASSIVSTAGTAMWFWLMVVLLVQRFIYTNR